jgi:plastocyanin
MTGDRGPRRLLAIALASAVALPGCATTDKPGGSPPTAPPDGVSITANDLAFDRSELMIPAGRPFALLFENRESAPHNVRLIDASSGDDVFAGEVFSGPDSRLYEVPPIAAGDYQFRCDVHPEMQGSAIAS